MSQQPHFRSKDDIHRFALDNWSEAIKAGDFERAIAFDKLHYDELVKKFEDVAAWDRWQADTLATRNKLAARMDKVAPLSLPDNDGMHRHLIVFHNYSGLAHESQLARNLAWLRSRGEQFQVEIVYLFGSDQYRGSASALYGIAPTQVHFLDSQSYEQAAERLTLLAWSRKVQGIIYPTTFFMAFWMSLFVPHANQKFVQMKYYPLHAGRIRRWAGGYRSLGEYYSIHGCDFEQLPILDLQLAKRALPAARPATDMLSIGSISRPEKISDPDYNRFIVGLLNRHTDFEYLYTGRPESLDAIPKATRQHPRCVSLGWVDPSTAISRFSIYLEPFPWGGGEMTLLALEAGLPYLTVKTEEAVLFGIYGFIKCLAEGRDPLLQFSFCESVTQLRERIEALAADSGLREQLGAAWKAAVLDYRPPSLDSWRSLLRD